MTSRFRVSISKEKGYAWIEIFIRDKWRRTRLTTTEEAKRLVALARLADVRNHVTSRFLLLA